MARPVTRNMFLWYVCDGTNSITLSLMGDLRALVSPQGLYYLVLLVFSLLQGKTKDRFFSERHRISSQGLGVRIPNAQRTIHTLLHTLDHSNLVLKELTGCLVISKFNQLSNLSGKAKENRLVYYWHTSYLPKEVNYILYMLSRI